MTESIVSESQPPSNPAAEVEYLLKELDYQVDIETKARDRMENMMQYLLTTIAAVIGAALLVNQLQANSTLLLFIATLLVFILSTAAFYRSCRLRYILTYARVNRNNIRCCLIDLGVPEADRLIEWEGNPSGFGKRMLTKLYWLMGLSCFLAEISGVLALLLIFHITVWPASLTNTQLVSLIVAPLILVIVIGIVLGIVLKNQKSKSDQLITDPGWQNLPDYDM